jgi:hypothetical protein
MGPLFSALVVVLFLLLSFLGLLFGTHGCPKNWFFDSQFGDCISRCETILDDRERALCFKEDGTESQFGAN